WHHRRRKTRPMWAEPPLAVPQLPGLSPPVVVAPVSVRQPFAAALSVWAVQLLALPLAAWAALWVFVVQGLRPAISFFLQPALGGRQNKTRPKSAANGK